MSGNKGKGKSGKGPSQDLQFDLFIKNCKLQYGFRDYAVASADEFAGRQVQEEIPESSLEKNARIAIENGEDPENAMVIKTKSDANVKSLADATDKKMKKIDPKHYQPHQLFAEVFTAKGVMRFPQQAAFSTNLTENHHWVSPFMAVKNGGTGTMTKSYHHKHYGAAHHGDGHHGAHHHDDHVPTHHHHEDENTGARISYHDDPDQTRKGLMLAVTKYEWLKVHQKKGKIKTTQSTNQAYSNRFLENRTDIDYSTHNARMQDNSYNHFLNNLLRIKLYHQPKIPAKAGFAAEFLKKLCCGSDGGVDWENQSFGIPQADNFTYYNFGNIHNYHFEKSNEKNCGLKFQPPVFIGSVVVNIPLLMKKVVRDIVVLDS